MPRSVGGAVSRRPDLEGGARRARSASSRRSGRRATGALLALLALALTGCTFQSGDPQDTLTVASEFNERIFSLYALVFWLAMAVFIVVEILLIYSVIRFRRRPGDPLPPQMHGNNKLEVAWTIAPALLLVIIAIPTLRTIIDTNRFLAEGAAPPDAVQVRVVGWQFWWQVEYPELGVVTANEIHVPVGRLALFTLEAAAPNPDAPEGFKEGSPQHSFWIPQMGGKQDILPTRVNKLSFTPRATGTFAGQCAELCGTSHANMRLRLVVHEQADFDAWVAQQRQQVAAPTDETLRRGQTNFGRCIACHTIAGTNAQGTVAPDLTHFGSRQTIAGIVDNTDENLRRWIENPSALKPGVKMPAFGDQLRPQDLDALVAYLRSLK